MVATAALMTLVFNALIPFMDISRAAKLTLAAVVGIWNDLATPVMEAGWLAISRPLPGSRRFICLPAGLLLGTALVISHALAAGESRSSSSSASHHPDLDYLKAVNSVAPPRDPELLFLLMAGYSNANLQGEGAEFFSTRLKEFDSRLTAAQKALYLSTIVARAARIRDLVAAPNWLRQRNNLYIGTSQAAKRRAGFRRELDCGHRSCRTPRPV